ncbi:M24 family metallopeptidase [Fuchsiella alkaliacetigena]|uniref:M24 family metallopeptidase n=1 Tax=Fuchsiella alkaliacetigena TaxID=957042 RepID=UPI00200A075B|nr:Xaa-Pro peptidase family protein [Fuchsiella alkaliacetigena]MCK8824967.1 Xaa-Pro peptidase family protein [Fuchsiella alkaliacetigena]
MNTVPETELNNRIEKFQEKLSNKEVDLAVIIENADLFYFSGTIQAEYLFIPQQGQPLLLVRQGLDRASKESNLEKIITFKSSKEIPEILKKQEIKLPQNLGLELDVVAYEEAAKLQNICQADSLSSITTLIRQVKMIKSEYEIKKIKRAADKLKGIPNLVADKLKSGFSELELSALIEQYLRQKGHAGLIRMRGLNNEIPMGICVAGANAKLPIKTDAPFGGAGVHSSLGIGASKQKIPTGKTILIDYLGHHQGYYADQTRLAIIGEPNAYLKKTYQQMMEMESRLSKYLTPDYSWQTLYTKGVELATEFEVEEYFMGHGENKAQYVGHGIGLELNEFPFLAKGLDFPLKPGMVVALEPKLLVPEIGVIGIENTYLVTEDKPEKLTTAPEELIVI